MDEDGAIDTTRAAAQPVDFLHDVSRRLAGTLNVRRTVLNALHLGVPHLADWVLLAQFDGDGAVMTAWDGRVHRTAAVRRLGEGLRRIRRVGQTELLHVALDADLADPSDGLASLVPDDELRADAAELRPADVLGVALTSHGTTLGALVAVRGHGNGYDEPDVRLVEEFAGRVAVTLDAARLYEERARTADTLQASLRPPELPALPGLSIAARYRAAHERMDIGGDFYDVHGAPDDVCVVIGDVCGKGVEAAVLTGQARQTVKTAARFDRSPSVILTALNDVLYAEGADRFVTVACARLRPDGDGTHVALAVAGHPPPLVVRRDGTVEEVEVRGTVAGVLPDLTYREVELRLARGDTMLLFTDGVYEARDRDGFFGMTRLRELLAGYAAAGPETLCEAVEQRVVEHLDGAEHDDIALLAIRSGD
jgi:serine phosphatase RsbU (regulator of sigma subunit)